MNVIVTMHYAHRALSSPLTTRNIIKSGGQKVKSGDKLHYGPRGRNPGGTRPPVPRDLRHCANWPTGSQ